MATWSSSSSSSSSIIVIIMIYNNDNDNDTDNNNDDNHQSSVCPWCWHLFGTCTSLFINHVKQRIRSVVLQVVCVWIMGATIHRE